MSNAIPHTISNLIIAPTNTRGSHKDPVKTSDYASMTQEIDSTRLSIEAPGEVCVIGLSIPL